MKTEQEPIYKLLKVKNRRLYYPLNLRRFATVLQAIMFGICALSFIMVFLLFTRPDNQYYATSFAGKITQLYPMAEPPVQTSTSNNTTQ